MAVCAPRCVDDRRDHPQALAADPVRSTARVVRGLRQELNSVWEVVLGRARLSLFGFLAYTAVFVMALCCPLVWRV